MGWETNMSTKIDTIDLVIDIDGTLCNTPETKTLEEFQALDHLNLEPNTKVIDFIVDHLIRYPTAEIYFLSARSEDIKDITVEWLYLNLGNLFNFPVSYYYSNTILRDYTCIANFSSAGEWKSSILLDLILPRDYAILIDDVLEVLDTVYNKNINVISIDSNYILNGSVTLDITTEEEFKIERDYYGIDYSLKINESEGTKEFKKFDSEKPDYSLLEPLAVEMYVEASQYGAKKYGRNNWKNMETKDCYRLVGAALRHFVKEFMTGNYLDSESGKSHLSHTLWQLVTLEKKIREVGFEEVRKYL